VGEKIFLKYRNHSCGAGICPFPWRFVSPPAWVGRAAPGKTVNRKATYSFSGIPPRRKPMRTGCNLALFPWVGMYSLEDLREHRISSRWGLGHRRLACTRLPGIPGTPSLRIPVPEIHPLVTDWYSGDIYVINVTLDMVV
jgi:hypothetical protein